MAIDFACPQCKKQFRVKDALAGKTAKCSGCEAKLRIPQPVAATPPPVNDLSDLLDDEFPQSNGGGGPLAAAAGPASQACPSCGVPLAESAVLCIECGYDRRTGAKRETKRDQPAPARTVTSRSDGASSKIATTASLGRGTLFSFFGAALGAAIWSGVALATGYEIGWIAWGLGALAGVGMAAGHDDDDGTFAGIIAGGMSILGIVVAKFIIYNHLMSQLDSLGIDADSLAALEAITGESVSFGSMFAPIDGLFILLATASAYRLGSGQATDD